MHWCTRQYTWTQNALKGFITHRPCGLSLVLCFIPRMACPRDLAEIACSEAIAVTLNEISKKTKISPFHLAVRVCGACHDHPPTKNIVPGCAYCARAGNALSKNKSIGLVDPNDIVAKYVFEISESLEKMQKEIRSLLTGEKDDDLEAELLKAMLDMTL